MCKSIGFRFCRKAGLSRTSGGSSCSSSSPLFSRRYWICTPFFLNPLNCSNFDLFSSMQLWRMRSLTSLWASKLKSDPMNLPKRPSKIMGLPGGNLSSGGYILRKGFSIRKNSTSPYIRALVINGMIGVMEHSASYLPTNSSSFFLMTCLRMLKAL